MGNKTKTWTSYSPGQTWTYSWFNGSSSSTWGPYAFTESDTKFVQKKTRNWQTTTNWKTLKRTNGYLPTLPMWESQRLHKYPQTQVTVTEMGPPWKRTDGLGVTPIFYPSDKASSSFTSQVGNVEIDAKSDALSKARNMHVNIPVLLAEGRQTVQMLRETARTLYRAYKAFRRGRYKKAAEILGITKPTGSAANHWLAYSYGWAPLVSDMVGLAKTAYDNLKPGGRAPQMLVRGMAVTRHRLSYDVPSAPFIWMSSDQWYTGEVKTVGRAWLLCRLVYSESALAAQTGFGLTDLALTAWEATPFSFVFDWVVDVGQYLENASALQGWDVLDGGWSYEVHAALDFKMTFNYPSYGLTSGAMPAGVVIERVFQRNVWTGAPPSLRVRSLDDALGLRRLITSAALWKQRTRGDEWHYHP